MILLALASAAAAAPPAASTVTVRQAAPAHNPWALSYGVDRRGARYGNLDYRLRWSFEDVLAVPRVLERDFARPRRSAEQTFRGLLQGSRLELYGVRVRPFRDLPLLPPAAGFDAGASTSVAPSPPAAPAARRRLNYSWERIYEDLEANARREAERFLIREGFDRTLPMHRDAPFGSKKALGDGLLNLGRGVWPDEARPPSAAPNRSPSPDRELSTVNSRP